MLRFFFFLRCFIYFLQHHSMDLIIWFHVVTCLSQSYPHVQTRGSSPCGGSCGGTSSWRPQHPLLQSPRSVPHSPALGLEGSVVERGRWFAIPPLHSQIGPQHSPCALLRPGVQPSAPQKRAEPHTQSGAHDDRSAGGPFSQLRRQASSGSQRFLWPHFEFQAYPGGLLAIGREWLFFWSQSPPCFSLGSGKNHGPVAHQVRGAITTRIYTGHSAVFNRAAITSHNSLIPTSRCKTAALQGRRTYPRSPDG